METKKKTPFLLVVLHLVQILAVKSQDCPRHPDLSCYNDFNHNITCVWNSPSVPDHRDHGCRLHAERTSRLFSYNASCDLMPFDSSKPAQKKCSLIFETTYIFMPGHVLSMNVSCIPEKISYNPECHIKVNPPGKPNVTNTTVFWLTQVTEHEILNLYDSQLQWKHQDQRWNDPSVQRNEISCKLNCEAGLEPDLLVQGETYEARVRVKAKISNYEGIWSDWSPTESWVSLVGKPKTPSGTAVNILNISLAGLAVFGLVLVGIFFSMRKTTWVYIIKKITGPPIPNPAKSAHIQTWISSNITSEYFFSILKPIEIVSVEVTSTVDELTFCEPDLKMMPENYNYESSGSSFSNPSYSELCSPSTVSSLAIEPCATDAPYGPVQGQVEEKNTKQSDDGSAEKDMEIMKLIVNASQNSEAVKVILDYERVEKLQMERLRLHSVDSGMCSYEEVSQDSMEVDGQDEGTQDKAEKKGGDKIGIDVQKLFRSNGGILDKNSIPVCFDYKTVPKLQPESPELPSLDSGVSSAGEEHESEEESMEDKHQSTHFLFPPHPFHDLKYASSSYPLNFSESSLSLFLPPLPSNNILEKMALNSMRVEPCGDGYKSVRQEQN